LFYLFFIPLPYSSPKKTLPTRSDDINTKDTIFYLEKEKRNEIINPAGSGFVPIIIFPFFIYIITTFKNERQKQSFCIFSTDHFFSFPALLTFRLTPVFSPDL